MLRPPTPPIAPHTPDVRPFAELARGPAATVYKALDVESGSVVLLKRLRGVDPERRRRFAEEARLAAEVDHPNVVRVLRASDDALVAEWVEGADLGAVVRDRPLPPPLAALVAREAARGLAAIHAAGILHRDISPGNLLLGADGAVKLTDFGLASLDGDSDGEVRGTLSTLAPEVVRGEAPSVRADLFSLGAVLAHAVTGRALFLAADSSATLDAVLHHDPSAALAADPRLPAPLVEVALDLLDKDPTARPDGAADVADRLTAVVAMLGNPSPDDLAAYLADPDAYRPPPTPAPLPAATPDRPAAPDRPARRPSAAPRRRWAAVAAVAAIVSTIAVGIGLSAGPEPDATVARSAEPLPTAPVEIVAQPDAPDPAAEPLGAPDESTERAALPPRGAPPPQPLPPTAPNPDADRPRPQDPDPDRPPRPPSPSAAVPPAAGTLAVRVEPWARVRAGDRDLGMTPVEDVSLPAGTYLVTLTNPQFPVRTVRVDVVAGERAETSVSLWDLVAQVTVEVSPWAEVAVDGEAWDTTPQERPLILTPGDHVLRFTHPTLGTREVPLRVAAGERRTVRVRMASE
ncbi:serine/threonine-protein kinase [Rubrivirga sp. IMCC43871]|uniref:serine/threonine-protein kinase n=1 Tax=Rubrivirga sp. IMCC43871 TaxID=3391575 RepID=UPI00398F9AB2